MGAFFEKNEPIHNLSEPEWVTIEVVMDSGAAGVGGAIWRSTMG